jgi:hypothetical protein
MTDDITLRRQAIQIASQLPDEYDDALHVLEYAKALAAFSPGKSGALAMPIPLRPVLKPVS